MTHPAIPPTPPFDGKKDIPTSKNSFHNMGTRTIGLINWLGLYTLYIRETRRFMKVWAQTLAAPAVTTILFMVIFDLALGGAGRGSSLVPFSTFLAPGLMVMAILQNAFANTSSSILISKVQGNIVDTLMPPLSALELTIGYLFGGMTRGIVVGLSVGLAFLLMPGVTIGIQNIWPVLYFAVAASAMMALIGVLTGVWADKFDHAAAVQNFIIAPLSLLSGTFYSISRLDETWQALSKANPFFYMIDGFRAGFIGQADSSLTVGVVYTVSINLVLLIIVYTVFKKGYKLKA